VYPAAQSIKDAVEGISDNEAMFVETLLFYSVTSRLKLLPYCPDDVEVLKWKMNAARAEKDYKTSDAIRLMLKAGGVEVKNK
jgi:cysteinyl-tRNA synthetase